MAHPVYLSRPKCNIMTEFEIVLLRQPDTPPVQSTTHRYFKPYISLLGLFLKIIQLSAVGASSEAKFVMSPVVALLSMLQLLESGIHGMVSCFWDVPVVSMPKLVGLGLFWHGEVRPCSSNDILTGY